MLHSLERERIERKESQMTYLQAGGDWIRIDVGDRASHCDEVDDNHEFRESCDRHANAVSTGQDFPRLVLFMP